MAELFIDVSKLAESEQEYEHTSIDNLVIVAAYQVEELKTPVNIENVVAAAFLLFPRRFQLRGFPQWPDAHIIASSWRRCRDRHGWVSGSAKAGFRLTELGQRAAEAFLRQDGTCPVGRRRQCDLDMHSEEVLQEFRRSKAFHVWTSTGKFDDHPSELLLALHCTTCADGHTKEQRLRELRHYATLAGDQEVLAAVQKAITQFGKDLNN